MHLSKDVNCKNRKYEEIRVEFSNSPFVNPFIRIRSILILFHFTISYGPKINLLDLQTLCSLTSLHSVGVHFYGKGLKGNSVQALVQKGEESAKERCKFKQAKSDTRAMV